MKEAGRVEGGQLTLSARVRLDYKRRNATIRLPPSFSQVGATQIQNDFFRSS